jgi:hypothetical protein
MLDTRYSMLDAANEDVRKVGGRIEYRVSSIEHPDALALPLPAPLLFSP